MEREELKMVYVQRLQADSKVMYSLVTEELQASLIFTGARDAAMMWQPPVRRMQVCTT